MMIPFRLFIKMLTEREQFNQKEKKYGKDQQNDRHFNHRKALFIMSVNKILSHTLAHALSVQWLQAEPLLVIVHR